MASTPRFTTTAQSALHALSPDVLQRYWTEIQSIAADPYGKGRPLRGIEDPYDRVLSFGDGWIRYSVRPLEEPEVLITDLDWYTL
ncbi:hypothetical protein PZB75_30160 [Streptomyces sp. AM 4-1-1]|uniref:type II toxin-antitoxin system RelE family toxin n=1 Tax=Streptomyces sp. AM 4-1-1 TaxID=3028710 RepID=UPI0023B8EDC5|nr:hypothetical protein [Streptomyces sp. AM 4-1-1]WEH37255.1 hypothetical protein PZB75_30160 [Streptomyces sp. AM 4-1-1]